VELKGLKINFLGDSIVFGAGVSGPDKIFHALLKKNAELAEVRSYGIGTTRYARQQKGLPGLLWNEYVDTNSFCERFDRMDDDADIVVVFGGTNDFAHGDAPLGCFDDRTPDTFYGACHYLYRGLIKKYLGKPIVIMTPLHRHSETKNTGELKIVGAGTLKDYVNAIREVAEYYSLPVLDLYANSGMQPDIPEIREMFMPDALHPNDKGHEIMARKLQKLLESL